jgi:hypothetical protein
MKNYRQGDVLVFGIEGRIKAPKGFTIKTDNVVIEGEITGHKHEVKNGRLYEKGDSIIIEAYDGCSLVHDEHKPIALAKGFYEIKIQEEYNEGKHASRVKD